MNEQTRKDAHPIPTIDEALDSLGGAKMFSSLDLVQGYHQAAIADEDIPKTAFRAGTGGLSEYVPIQQPRHLPVANGGRPR